MFDTSQQSYIQLRDIVAEGTTPLIAWVGSGMSVSTGLPDWAGLRERLVGALEGKALSLDGPDGQKLQSSALRIVGTRNPWQAFQLLHDALGETTYREEIRAALAPGGSLDPPQAYTELWELGIRGLFNLNLDRLATRALSQVHPGGNVVEFHGGANIGNLPGVLSGHTRFVANLHGVTDQRGTWVLTLPELKRLSEQPGYQTVLSACLSTHSILFLGVSADDEAVGGHLQRLAQLGIDGAPHFWLTDRRDYATDQWAEGIGVRLIRYDSTGGDHSAVQEFFDDLRAFVAVEKPSDRPLLIATEADPDPDAAIPSPAELLKLEPDQIRHFLNRHARRVLEAVDPTAEDPYGPYEEFCKEYDQAIYQAWYTTTAEGRNTLFGYRLEQDVARGAFGRVYRARDSEGGVAAVKVLLEEIRNEPALRHTFRRGVDSMRILHHRGVEGMVAYKEASEIPAFVVMEWVPGPNLEQAKLSGYVEDWDTILKIAVDLARIIRTAHFLPERVLHRDIRPSNVMLSDYHTDPHDWSVLVLDFDLSWHKGAYDKTTLPNTVLGYLAPEQMRDVPGVSTRHAAVDSFGLGMTLLYLCSGQEPQPTQHRHEGWDDSVRAACEKVGHPDWVSLPRRFARLIVAATRDEQSERWDMSEILAEVELLQTAAQSPSSVLLAEFLAEELAARCSVMTDYEWDQDVLRAVRKLPTGLEVSLSADPARQVVRLDVEYASTGVEQRGGMGKYIAARAATTAEQLTASGWRVVAKRAEALSVSIKAETDAASLSGQIDRVSSALDKATHGLRFSDR